MRPPDPCGSGPTSPALSGRLSIMQRGRLGQLDDNCRRGQGLDQPGRVAVPGRAGRPPAARGRPWARPGPVDLEQHEGLPRERAAAACSCARTCRPRSGRSCEQRACRRGSFLTHCVGVSSWEKKLSVQHGACGGAGPGLQSRCRGLHAVLAPRSAPTRWGGVGGSEARAHDNDRPHPTTLAPVGRPRAQQEREKRALRASGFIANTACIHTPTTRHTMGTLRGTRLPSGRARTREPHMLPDPPPLAEPRYEA